MVLLTSSTLSVLISSSIVCASTFLLFLSGYVLQQQTVRSLQEALHRPPEPGPTFNLPEQFRSANQTTPEVEADTNAGPQVVVVTEVSQQLVESGTQISVDDPGPAQQSETEGNKNPVAQIPPPPPLLPEVSSSIPQVRLGYILALSTPPTLCSALLFFEWQRQFGASTTSLILLYPSFWESSLDPGHTNALGLIRNVQDKLSVILRPVEISTVWEGVSIESQLLAEIQHGHLDFDRVLYLRSPGLALDVTSLETALSSSSLKTSWISLASDPTAFPTVMLRDREKGLMIPRGDLRGLVSTAMTRHEDHHEAEMDVEVAAKTAAYMVFDEQELEHRRGEKRTYNSVFERFERGRKEVCGDMDLTVKQESSKPVKRKRWALLH